MQKSTTITLGVIIGAVVLVTIALTVTAITRSNAQIMGTQQPAANATNATAAASSMPTTFTAQKTAVSDVDTLPGHQMHQAVVVLPERNDGKIWVGTISWTSSKPVEVRLLHMYDSSVSPDTEHGKPVTAPFGNGSAAISLILPTNGAATVPSYYSGSMDFAATQVAFHTLGGIKFTVTYTIDAEAKELTK